MKKKKIFWIVAVVVVIIIISFVIFINKNRNRAVPSIIPSGYIAVFHGGSAEVTYETYIYKEDNDSANSGFDYINVTSTTDSWESSKWNSKITKRGSVQWTDDVFIVAKENGAYSYVTLPNSNRTYTIDDYMDMFIMN